jgi:hypothetical protein
VARYSTSKYGAGKYGADAITEPAILTWIVSVDWTDAGYFGGGNEANRVVNINLKCGREKYLSTGGGGFEHMRPAVLTLKLDNHDRRYDPRNASSPLYPNVRRGHKMQVRVRDNASGLWYTQFTGMLDDIRPVYRPGGGDVTFECVGYQQQLNDTLVSADTRKFGTTITAAINALLSDAEFRGGRSLDTEGQKVVSFAPANENAGAVVHQLADASLGQFFVDRDGIARFYSRSHSSWTTHTIDQSQVEAEIEVSQTWDSQFNQIKITSQNQIYRKPSVVFSLSTPTPVSNGSPALIRPKYERCHDPQVDTATLAGNSSAGGGGTDISTHLSASGTLGVTGGRVTVSSTVTGFITQLDINGRMLDSSPEEFDETDSTYPASIFGLKCFTLNTPYIQDRNYAKAFVGILGSDNDFLYNARDAFVVTITARPDIQFAFELLDKVHFTSDYLDVDDTFWILGYQHKSNGTMQDITTTLWLDKILIDASSVSAAGISEEQMDAPLGFEDPAGSSLGTGGGAGMVSMPVYHNDVLVGNAQALNFLDDGYESGGI